MLMLQLIDQHVNLSSAAIQSKITDENERMSFNVFCAFNIILMIVLVCFYIFKRMLDSEISHYI